MMKPANEDLARDGLDKLDGLSVGAPRPSSSLSPPRRRTQRLARAAWWRSVADGGPEIGSWRPLAAASREVVAPSVELARVLHEAADRIAELGTDRDQHLLEAMAEVVAPSTPGVAAALVQRPGSEVSRQRAFGLAHTHLLLGLGRREHARLLDLLDRPEGLDRTGRVA